MGNYYEVTGSTITKYYYFGGQRVAMKQGSAVTYLHSDHPSTSLRTSLGSTSVTSGATTSSQTRGAYPFGAVRTTSGTLPTDFTFTGQRVDNSDSLMYYGARYYDAYLNRWTQPDTIVSNWYNPQSLNRYAYTLNNPVKYTDPTGHMQICADGDQGGGCSRTETVSDILDLFQTQKDNLVEDLLRGYLRAHPNYDMDADRTLDDTWKGYVGIVTFQARAEDLSERKSLTLGEALGPAAAAIAAGIVINGGPVEPLPQGMGIIADAPQTRIHGNSYNSPKETYLYDLKDFNTGEHLKYGITSASPPEGRYSAEFMKDKIMDILHVGPRRDIAALERELVIKNPGPLNREPWARPR